MAKIAVVVPTIRPESYEKFLIAWNELFTKYSIDLITVFDGENPYVELKTYGPGILSRATDTFLSNDVKAVMGEYSDLIYNKNDGVRNLGFALAYRMGHEVIISLDDDTKPCGDTIAQHLSVLHKKHPVSWMNTVEKIYMRGFPYNIRQEAECVFSHGVWKGVADFDATTQLMLGTPDVKTVKSVVPKGILFPVCVMNVAMTREVIPHYYQAPMVDGINRFADIWAGIEMKKAVDAMGKCAVTGFAHVIHERASDPFVNLEKEAKGVRMNENYGEGEYFEMYRSKIARWQEFLFKS